VDVQHVLLYVVPPLAGAIIGYVTNAIAIKMLFRPLRAYYIGRLRVPFTPGIIPRQRGQLADSIAAMVEKQLLTAETVDEHLQRPEIATAVQNQIGEYTQKLLQFQLPRRMDAGWEGQVRKAAGWFGGWLEDRVVLGGGGNGVAGDALLGGIGNRPVPRALRRAVLRPAILLHRQNKPLSALLPASTASALRHAADAAYNDAHRQLLAWLRTPAVQQELAVRGRRILSAMLDRLKSLQRLLIAAGRFDRSLHEQMPHIIADLVDQLDAFLSRPENRQRLMAELEKLIELFLQKSPVELEKTLQTDWRALSLRLLDYAWKQAPSIVSASFDQLARRQESVGSRPLENLIVQLFKLFLESYGGRQLGDLASLTRKHKEQLDAFLTQQLLSFISRRLPAILHTADIHSMVKNRIDRLDALEVERLLLQIMQRHFRYINIFGAVLGACIGAMQIFLARLQ
jgi:uncharacterized membrane protein YheB (UPF0754 family)